MKIYFEDNHIIVIEKKANQPTQQDDSQDLDVLSELKSYLKVTYNKPGNVYAGMVHRLDRPVGGVMVFARTSKAAGRLSEQIRQGRMTKIYTAVVEKKMPEGIVTDYLVKNKKTNTSYTVSKTHPEGKYAEMMVTHSRYDAKHDLSKIIIDLKTGRSHQIRVQCASRSHPIWGDARYNPAYQSKQQIALWSTQLVFNHPITQERLSFRAQTPSVYPFSLW